jgi:large subunit ribosomal protein L2
MFLKYKKPITPSLRQTILINSSSISKKKRLKCLTIKKKKIYGRNNSGKLTIFTKGGGHKRLLRVLTNNYLFQEGVIEAIEYDPNRSAFIARLYTSNKEHIYIIACHLLKKGNFIKDYSNSSFFKLYLGSFYKLKQLPVGSFIYNLNFPNSKNSIATAAGSSIKLVNKTLTICHVKLPSGEHRLFSPESTAFLGIASNSLFRYAKKGKAGRSRWLNKRPKVRGVAMNPVDHPHGGGEGKTSGGRPSVTPWGKIAKGKPTRKRRLKTNKFIILKRK